MVGWTIRTEDGQGAVDLDALYDGFPSFFSIKLFFGGEFTAFPGRRYVNGQVKTLDAIDGDEFCVHDIDEMMEVFGYSEDGMLLYYHFKRPLSDLDVGLFALASDADINHLRSYVGNHKLIEVYIEHGSTKLHTYQMSPNPTSVRIREIVEPPACSRRLFITWKDSNEVGPSEAGPSSTKSCVVLEDIDDMVQNDDACDNVPKSTPKQPTQTITEDDIFQTPPSGQRYHGFDAHDFESPNVQDYLDTPSSNYEFDAHEDQDSSGESESSEEGDSDGGDGDGIRESSGEDCEDSDFIVDKSNLMNEPTIDMKEYFLHIDKDAEWIGDLGGAQGNDENMVPEEIELVNNDIFLTDSSSDEDGSRRRKKSVKSIRRAQQNLQARVGDPFYIHQTFATAKELKEQIQKHAVETRREIELLKNDKNRIRAICVGSIPSLGELDDGGPTQKPNKVQESSEVKKCPWVLYASRWKQDDAWEVRTYDKRHLCLQNRKLKSCTYKYLSKQIVDQIESNPTVPTRALKLQLEQDFQVDLSKMKVFRAKTEALNQVRGDFKVQYSNLRDYVLELQARNPDTTAKIDIEPEANPASDSRTFTRIYVCLGPLKKGFKAGKRDYLGLDGCFMKGPYPDQILTAVGLDGNSHTYPLAYAVVEAENIDSWTWFLNCLGDDLDLNSNSNFTFVSDRQKGLLQAISRLFPCAEHRFCLRHIHENMKKMWRGKEFKDMLCKCASATTVQEFNRAMEEFRKLNNDCYMWVKAIPPQHWSRSHFTGRAHCDGLLNNLCETINNQLRDARDQPIINCLEFIREYLMLRLVTVQAKIDKTVGPLTPTAACVLEKNKAEAALCKGLFCGNAKYQVSGPWMDQCVVDMKHHTCSCRRWELVGIPCKHALVAIWDMRKNNQDVGLPETWVHPTYWLKTWKEMYSFKIEPLNGRNMWEKSLCPTTLLPPKYHVPVGRPKKKRRKSAVEMEDMVSGTKASKKDKSVTCSKCNKLGHNKRSCKGQVEGQGKSKQPTRGGNEKATKSTKSTGVAQAKSTKSKKVKAKPKAGAMGKKGGK